jgi:hypothetical protein
MPYGLGQSSQPLPPPGVSRTSGTDGSSRIEYVRFLLAGTLLPPSNHLPPKPALPGDLGPSGDSPVVVPPTLPPTLIAQCTQRPSGKQAFELLANFGGVTDQAYYPPWTPANSNDLFPPRLEKALMTMEFLGYTHVKPVKRQWEALAQPTGQYRYNPPSAGSSNMEDSTYYLRFLLALPTLRLTLGDKIAEFTLLAKS